DGTDRVDADVGVVLYVQADHRELVHEAGVDLLAPFPAKPTGELTVARVQVAADADRPQIVEARVAAGLRPPHQEVARSVAKDQVRDHLFPRPVALHLASWSEFARPRNQRLEVRAGHAVAAKATPAGVGHQRTARDDQNELVVAHPSVAALSSARAASSRACRAPASIVSVRRRSIHESCPSLSTARRPATNVAFVARMPAPISVSLLARLVAGRQPP